MRTAGEFTERGRARVQADEEPIGGLARENVGQAPVAGAEIDRHPAPEAGQDFPCLLVGAFEAFAAHDVHAASIARDGGV
jgi:hypothetical protein